MCETRLPISAPTAVEPRIRAKMISARRPDGTEKKMAQS